MIVAKAFRRFAAALLLSSVPACGVFAMSFEPRMVDGRLAIVAIGQITLDAPTAFAASAVVPGTFVYLNSPGGNVGAAVQLGSLFRSRGVTAVVAGVTENGVPVAGACYSACVYALVGASRRIVPARSQVGIHRMLAVADGGGVLTGAYERAEHRAAASTLMDYIARMGVDPSMIAYAERTPSIAIHVLTARELRHWGVTNAR